MVLYLIDHEGNNKQDLKTLLRISKRAASALKPLLKEGESLKIELTVEADDIKVAFSTNHAASLDVFFAEAKKHGLQLRVALLTDSFEVRKVVFESLHEVQNPDLEAMVHCLELKEGDHVLDMMCGYGAVGECVLAYAEHKNMKIKLSFCDLHASQIGRMKPDIRSQAIEVKIGDARQAPFADQAFDAIAIKMGVHDVPQYDQQLIFQEAYRMLKPNGVLAIWDVMCPTAEMQDAFSDIIQKKDELAGFESYICDRYFFREDQAYRQFHAAGFVQVKKIKEVHYKQSTLKRRDAEFGGDPQKLSLLNTYIRSYLNEPLKKSMQFEEHEDDVIFVVPNVIMSAKKP